NPLRQNSLLVLARVNLQSLSLIHLFTLFRYHEWMKCPELQHLTASEPPTREQEYDMQWSWREDDDNCTFIIFDKQRWAVPSIEEEQCMVGDVNMFLTDPTDLSLAELEIMTLWVVYLQVLELIYSAGLQVHCIQQIHFTVELALHETGGNELHKYRVC
uniref:Uncharacterized protein n=1 Tax=Monopterus albus TaxID=43700 RepID=A0A3Q3IHF2_MONAL